MSNIVHVRQVIPRDAIPSIDDPTFGRDYFGDDGDDVIVIDSSPPKAFLFGFSTITRSSTTNGLVLVRWNQSQ